MNSLNSVLIEGAVDGALNFKPATKELFFAIESIRSYKEDGALVERKLFFRAKAEGRLAEVCNSYLKEGRGVRLVGRLDVNSEGCVFIKAEHVEFKPTADNVDQKEEEPQEADEIVPVSESA